MRWLLAFFFAFSLFSEAFVFVHVGPTPPPYLPIAIEQTRLFNKTCPIYLLIDQKAISKLPKHLSAYIIPLESLQKSDSHKKYEKNNTQKEFWRYTTERFFYLEEFIRQYKLRDVFHMENDIMIYFDATAALPLFQTHYSGMIAACFDNDNRCIPSFLYISHLTPIEKLAEFIAQKARHRLNDMELLSQFKNAFRGTYADHLPIVMPSYDRPLRNASGQVAQTPSHYTNHFDAFQSIFDAAAWGQYLGGIDPLHKNSKPGFINESCLFNPSYIQFEWRKDEEGRQVPYVTYKGQTCRLNNLHIHCKNLAIFSSLREVMPVAP
jgi:hypothetical protein